MSVEIWELIKLCNNFLKNFVLNSSTQNWLENTKHMLILHTAHTSKTYVESGLTTQYKITVRIGQTQNLFLSVRKLIPEIER